MSKLHGPLQIGDLKIPNRIIMAPLTRCRADAKTRVPTPVMVEYYRQRAQAGLILTEATSVNAMGVGYPRTPGIWSAEQVAGWQPITRAVHDAGGHIFMQLWHVGRISDPIYLNGATPVAPSAVAPSGHVSLVRPLKNYVTPRALELSEIAEIIEDYRIGAQNALAAGFDGVELHGANGYLLDQFLQDGSNHRTDEYGGSLENRARLMLAATDAAISVFGAQRVGMHLAPRSDSHGVSDSHPLQTFGHIAEELKKRKIAFICARENEQGTPRLGPELKKIFGGVYIANEGFTLDTAEAILARGEADAVAFGKDFIANPDLPARLAQRAPLNPARPELFYGEGAEGYTDYPAL